MGSQRAPPPYNQYQKTVMTFNKDQKIMTTADAAKEQP
jgi:hypothetical protein